MIVTELLGKFGLDVDKESFGKADKALGGMKDRLGTFLKVAGSAFAVSRLASFVNELVTIGSELNDASLRVGVTTHALQELGFAAKQTGASQQDLENGLKFLSKNAVEAAGGSKEMSAAWKKLGVNVKDSQGNIKSADVLLSEVSEGLKNTENASERTALAVKLLGRGGLQLLPMLQNGKEGLAQFRKEFDELGGGFDKEFIERADSVGDNMDRLRLLSASFKNALGNVLLPIVDRALVKFIDLGKALFKLAKGTDIVRVAFISLATISAVSAARALLPWLPFVFTFLTIAAVITTVIALIEDIYKLLTGGKSLIGQWLDEWAGIGTTDQLVRRWAEGIEILVENLEKLFKSVKENPVDALLAPFRGAWQFGQDLGDAHAREAKWARMEEEIKRLREKGRFASADALQTNLETERGDNVTAGRGMSAPLALDPSIPRAAGRGMSAPLAKGSAGFGQAAPDAVPEWLRPGNVDAAAATVGGAPTKTKTGGGGGAVTSNTSVTVNAQTNADPKEIARIATQKAEEVHKKHVKNLREASVNRVPRGQ